MKVIASIALICFLLSSSAFAQTIVGDAERLWGVGDTIDGETLTTIREGGVDDAGNVASNPTASTDVGGSGQLIVTTINDVPTVIARRGDTVPGGDFIESFSDHVERVGDFVLYIANRLDDDPDNGAGDDALLLRNLNDPDPIVVARTNVTTVPGRTVPFTSIFRSEGFGLGQDGRMAFAAEFVDGTTGEGVYWWDNGVLSKIADTDDSFDGSTFTDFDNAKADENGTGIVFEARRDGDAIESIYLFDGSSLIELISTNDFFPGSTNTIDGFSVPDIDGGRVVVQIRGNGGEQGIFVIDGSGDVTLVADLNTPLPDSPLNTGPAEFFIEWGIGGEVVYFVAIRPVNNSADVMVWRNGLIERVLSEGDLLDGLTVTSPQSSMNRQGISRTALAMNVSFGDQGRALYQFSLSQSPQEALPVPLPWVSVPLAILLALFGAGFTRQRSQARLRVQTRV